MATNNSGIKRISKALADIRLNLISSRDYSKIDSEIDRSIDKLTVSDLNVNTINYAETMKQYMTKSIDTNSINKEVTANILNTPETLARFGRYSNAEEVIYNIPQCSRALKVLASGILSPDNVTKTSLSILASEDSDADNVKEILNNIKLINKEIKFEDFLDTAITETLKYGDKFIEICSYKSKEIPITQSMYLQERIIYESTGRVGEPPQKMRTKIHNVQYDEPTQFLNEDDVQYFNKFNKKVYLNIVEDGSPNELNFSQSLLHEKRSRRNRKAKEEKLFENIEEVRLIQHDPRRVVKLQTERFKVNLGYLILPEGSEDMAGLGMVGMSSTAGGGYSSGGATPIASGLQNDVFKGVEGLYVDLIKMIKRHVNSNDLKVNKKEMKEMLARLVKDLETDSDKSEIKIRYVPPERMEHFMINDRIHFPYGEGIFEKTMHAAKELIALKTAVTVRRITDAVDKRVIYIESTMARNSRNIMTSFREALRKRKFTMNSLSNISTIPSQMTNFEDYILTQKNGKRSVEFDTIPTTSSIRDIAEELKFFRDELVSSLDVPPAFIGIEENVNGKSTLAHESALFAETILSYQKVFNIHIFRFFNNLHKLLYGRSVPDTINITLQPPKMLAISTELEHLETVSRIMELSTSLGIEKETLRKRYVPVDWEEEEDVKVKDQLNKRGEASKKSDDDIFGGGMMGGMGGMGMGGAPMM
jgi:hypothetical protein